MAAKKKLKGFIEVNQFIDEGVTNPYTIKNLININTIENITDKRKNVEYLIICLVDGSYVMVTESYDELKEMIAEAQ